MIVVPKRIESYDLVYYRVIIYSYIARYAPSKTDKKLIKSIQKSIRHNLIHNYNKTAILR